MSICAVPSRFCCDCSHPSGSYARCGDCRDQETARRALRQANGQCRRCAAPVAILGDRRCPSCAAEEQAASKSRTAADRAAGICIGCRQRKIAPPSKLRCGVCLAKQREAAAVASARRAEQKRLDYEHGNLLLRQTMEYLREQGIDPPAELVEHCRERGVEC